MRLKWLRSWPPSRPDCPVFDLLKAATNNFSPENRLGEGGWGTVYKGQTRDELEVAIKICSGDASGKNLDFEYETECHVLAKLKHPNIIKLLGHYNRLGKRILVYEYMANGSLDKFIFDLGRGVSLDWSSRFQIIEGIAQGLLYLHTHTDGHIVHGDLKPSNILLDFVVIFLPNIVCEVLYQRRLTCMPLVSSFWRSFLQRGQTCPFLKNGSNCSMSMLGICG